MNYFESLLNKFKQVKPSQIFEGVLRGNEEFFIDLVRKEQIREKGIDGQGDIIGFYSPFSPKVRNLPISERLGGVPYDLYDTGTFYNSFELKEVNGAVYIMADGKTGKDEDIINKYGKEILYFTEESMFKVFELAEQKTPGIILNIINSINRSA